MKFIVKKSLLAIAVSGVLASSAAYATNGYFGHGYSTKEKGLAGAGTAFSQDALASANNPAGMAFIGNRMDIGAALFSPSRSYTVTGTITPPNPVTGEFGSAINAADGQTVESDSNLFLIPHFAYNRDLGNDSSVGAAIYGNGGMNTIYPASSTPDVFGSGSGNGTFYSGNTGINLEQLFLNVNFAKKLNDKHAFGGSLILAGQRFAAKGIDLFRGASLSPDNLSGNKHSYSYGAGVKLGYQGEVAKGFRVGVAYQSKISMSEFDEYKGLFAEGGDFDIPSSYNVGISIDVGPTGTIVADVQRINFSEVSAIANPVSNMFPGTGTCFTPAPTGPGCLGGADGAGFGWKDMTVYKIGYQFDVGKKHTVRLGYSFTDQPIPESETLFNVLAPAVIEQHFTAGWTMKIGADQELNLAGMYAPNSSVKGANPFDGGASQIEIEMSQWELQAGWAWKY